LLGVFASLLGIVEAELEAGRTVMNLRWNRQSAECDQQTLCGDGVGNDDADQRAQSTSCGKSDSSRAHVPNYHPWSGYAAWTSDVAALQAANGGICGISATRPFSRCAFGASLWRRQVVQRLSTARV
jgi:hypothetical protein